MRDIIKSLFKQFFFWFLFFAFTRIIFLMYYSKQLAGIDFVSISAVFPNALKLDLSTVCYIISLPFLLLTLQSFYPRSLINKTIPVYNYVIIFFYSLITTAELGIYEEWQTKLNSKAIKYIENPCEIYSSASSGVFILLIIILTAQFFAGFFAYRKWFWHKITVSSNNVLYSLLFFFITLFFLIPGLRGGWQQIPINQSESYFSKHYILNLVAVNSGWNIIHSIHQNFYSLDKNPFMFFSSGEAERTVNEIHQKKKDSVINILKVRNPDIVMILLEGWSADLIESLGGEKGITPCFKQLEKDGVLFENFYASGSRSEQGMAAVFSGFPATPLAQIARQPDKFSKLPCLTHKLIDIGYSTSFYFGGQLIYGNMKGYIYSNRFGRIREGYMFSNDYPRGKLGIHDEFIYPEIICDLGKEKHPFFSVYFTLSSHSPYDIPDFRQNIGWCNIEKEYVNAAYYSDSCLGDFISRAEKQEWFKNTLFIIVADHGHSSYKLRDAASPGYQKIPMLFYGDVIKEEYRGTGIGKIGSQVDIASTLLHQLGQKSDDFYWSRDMLNTYSPGFAYYGFEVGFGWVCDDGEFIYDHTQKTVRDEKLPAGKKDSVIKAGKAYLQQVFQQYLTY